MRSILMLETAVIEVEFHVFSSAHPTADMESEAFSASYLEKYYPT